MQTSDLRTLPIERLFDCLDGFVSGIDEGSRGSRLVALGIKLRDIADWDRNAHLLDSAAIKLDEREIDRAVGEVPGKVVARLARLDFAETEDLLIELGSLLQVVDFQCEMDDAVHVSLGDE